MQHIDPVVVPIPDVWQQHPEIGPFMEYIMRHLHDTFLRLGGGNDSVDDLFNINTTETTPTSAKVAFLLTEIDHLKSLVSTLNGKIAALEKNQVKYNNVIRITEKSDADVLSIVKQGS